MNTAKKFISNINPYRKKHIAEEIDMFGNPAWFTIPDYLTNQKIENSISGEIETGYFSTNWPKAITLDIDNHANTPGKLKKIYEQIKSYFPTPTYSYKSPNGLHLYWLLAKSQPIKFLYHSMIYYLPRDLLRHIDIRPTTKAGLRIPQNKRLIEKISTRKKYDYSDIFTGLDIYEAIKEQKTIPKKTTINYIFINGYSNETFTKCTAYLKCSGFTESETVQIIREKLFRDGYTGELIRKPQRLADRIASSYRNLKAKFDPLPKQQKLEHIETANKYLPLVKHRRPQLQKTFLKFVAQLISWVEYIEQIKAEPTELDYWSAIYPTFRAKTNKGYYPLPQSLLYKITSNIQRRPLEFLTILKNKQIILATDHSYSSTLHICKYYLIDTKKLKNPNLNSEHS